jgi:Holliday junction DNA helicase RuvA
MIASLRGRLLAKDPQVVVDIGALGLAVQVSARTAAQLPPVGGELSLVTYLHVREDHLALYGFANERERELFLLLLGVNGIGPRVALTVLSSAPLEELERSLRDGDEAYLVRLPGVGRKTAARLVLELQGKLQGLPTEAAASIDGGASYEEATLALASLGLTPRAAREAVEKVDRGRLGKEPRVEEIVKAALQAVNR